MSINLARVQRKQSIKIYNKFKGAKKIMVINNDPQAPFFTKADYGVIGDLHEILPAITQELKKNQN